MKRRTLLLMATMAAALIVACGVALARDVQCEPNVQCNGTNKDDLLVGTDGIDNMVALKGDDVLKGYGGDDNTMRGYQGNDRLLGGPGDDHMDGGTGKDVLKGGDGFDVYIFEQNWGKETIDDTPLTRPNLDTGHQLLFIDISDNLTIHMKSGPGPEVKNKSKTSQLNWSNDLIDIVSDRSSGHDRIVGRDVADNIQLGNYGSATKTISAGGGNDSVNTFNGIGGDLIDCGDGNDTVRKDAGDFTANCENVQ